MFTLSNHITTAAFEKMREKASVKIQRITEPHIKVFETKMLMLMQEEEAFCMKSRWRKISFIDESLTQTSLLFVYAITIYFSNFTSRIFFTFRNSYKALSSIFLHIILIIENQTKH